MTTETKIDANGADITPRYTPAVVSMFVNGRGARVPVEEAIYWPAGTAPKGCPIRIDCNVLELRTAHGSRWYGVLKAHINSELRMVVTGFPAKFEEMAAWEICEQV